MGRESQDVGVLSVASDPGTSKAIGTRSLLVQPNPVVASLPPYGAGRPNGGIELRLDRNERPAPPPEVTNALADSQNCEVSRYPSASELERALAQRFDVDADSVLVTTGADDALERAIRVVAAQGRSMLLTTPTFEMLGRYARLAGLGVVEVPWWTGDFPLDKVCQGAGSDVAALAVVSPNNPTGAVISRAALEQLAERLPATLVLLDHAYVEFADEDLTRVALRYPNLVVFRTFSKAWGCAGLRVGYAVGDPRVVGWMRVAGHPYPVSAHSLQVLHRLCGDGYQPDGEGLDAVRRRRGRLVDLLNALGAEPMPSQANFVLARFSRAPWVHRALISLGVAVRAFPGHDRLREHLRITVPGDDDSLARLARALRTVLAPEALLFDLDGVLADVSGSYREAILATAHSFGVELTAGDVARAKQGGGANNDWQLTRRLMAERGVARSLDEVTTRFEGLYQGSDGRPGLRRHEQLLVDPGLLTELADRIPLAIVTGRPRRDAERFLDQHGVTACLGALVALEDAPSKPDPRPVRLALDRLGVEHAWMVGDTPDDVRAAGGAGVLPIGVVAPGDDPKGASESLSAAGAAMVLDRVTEIEEVMP